MAQSTSDATTTEVAHRYTVDGGDDVEQLIARHQDIVSQAVRDSVRPRHFAALILIGSFARGEGGYRYRGGKPESCNDYDYFVVLRGANRRSARSLQAGMAELADKLGAKLGIAIALTILRQETLRRSPATLMFAEMLGGHRIVSGDADILKRLPPMPTDALALGEFTRLLLNRGALLLMNQQAIASVETLNGEKRDRFMKYAFKAVLASGDAYLATRGLYHPLYEQKWQRLNSIENELPPHFLRLYADAMEAKLRPDYARYALLNLASYQKYIVRVWCDSLNSLEEVRLGRSIPDWVTYASPSIDKGQSDRRALSLLRNLAINLRDYGPMELLANTEWSMRYPRERLISVLPVLLGERNARAEALIRRTLANVSGNQGSAAHAFLSQWHRYA